ncbi:MAG TPA: adenylate/guanylate cyclase domain-containing protein, partial [Anaerolineales bacterium]|nr:adenylate/guanylate cyclase domain-containing protein [Anaerolineales bacterium]
NNKGTWTITVRSAEGEPREYALKPGVNTVGRSSKNDIVVNDVSASRHHAEFIYEPTHNVVSLQDLRSTNGTYINRNRLTGSTRLNANDVVRIGTVLLTLTYLGPGPVDLNSGALGTRPLTRELLVESFDQHAALMYEVASQLNTVLDVEMALNKLTQLVQQSLGTDKCEIILANQFHKLQEFEFPVSIAKAAIEQKTTIAIPNLQQYHDLRIRESAMLRQIRSALCVPVLANEKIIALFYMYKTNPETRPFEQQDIKLAVAISHLASLTIQRVMLLERVREEQKMRNLFQRFLSSSEVDYLLQDYLRTGQLPGLKVQKVTVLFTDIADSTHLAEKLGVEKFGELLTEYYTDITEIVFEHGGLINKFLGDGVMAVFGMTANDRHPEHQAVRAGVAIRKKIATRRQAGQEYHVGIGINTGMTMAGYIGTQEHVELTVIGDSVNIASRLESLARPDKLLIGPATRAGLTGEFETVRIGETSIRGRTEPIQVYQVLTETGKLNAVQEWDMRRAFVEREEEFIPSGE